MKGKTRKVYQAGHPHYSTNSWNACGWGDTIADALADLEKNINGQAIKHMIELNQDINKRTGDWYGVLPTEKCAEFFENFKNDVLKSSPLVVREYIEEWCEDEGEWKSYSHPRNVGYSEIRSAA